jgi:hypothetical protein
MDYSLFQENPDKEHVLQLTGLQTYIRCDMSQRSATDRPSFSGIRPCKQTQLPSKIFDRNKGQSIFQRSFRFIYIYIYTHTHKTHTHFFPILMLRSRLHFSIHFGRTINSEILHSYTAGTFLCFPSVNANFYSHNIQRDVTELPLCCYRLPSR